MLISTEKLCLDIRDDIRSQPYSELAKEKGEMNASEARTRTIYLSRVAPWGSMSSSAEEYKLEPRSTNF